LKEDFDIIVELKGGKVLNAKCQFN